MQPIGGTNWHTQIFRDGSLEHASSMHFDGEGVNRFIDTWHLQITLVNIVPRFLKLQQSLGITPPVTLMLTLINVGTRKLRIGEVWMDAQLSEHTIDRHDVELPDVVVTDYTEPASQLLKPVFDGLWNAAGLEACTYYRNGEWSIDPSWLDDPE